MGKYISCGPLTPTKMSRIENVDYNGDGLLTLDEATFLDRFWSKKYKKESTLERTWKYYADVYREDASWPQSTGNVTSLPLAWMKQWQDELALCTVSDPALCGNLEARGILRGKFPGDLNPSERIRQCQDLITNKCYVLFGQVHRLYRRWSSELCGGVSTNWMDGMGIMTVDYSQVLKYVKDSDSIVTDHYLLFLVVIMLIWVMCMLEEFRNLLDWWMVIITFPTKPKNDETWLVEGPSSIRMLAMPWRYKAATVLLNLLPRTIVVCLLCGVGSFFLIGTDSYGDLIQNGMALGFLVEIDNMFFTAVSREENRDLVNSCEPLTSEVDHQVCRQGARLLRSLPVGAVYTALILAVTSGLIFHEYSKVGGKYDMGQALRCLCHASGRNCVAAQILGEQNCVAADEVWKPG